MTDKLEEAVAVTHADRLAAADLIEAYWSGANESMMKLARSYRAGHSQGTFVRAFARHRIATRNAAMDEAAEWLKWGDDQAIEDLCDAISDENRKQRAENVFVGQPYLDLFAQAILALKGER